MKEITLLDPSIKSHNLGDLIIRESITSGLQGRVRISRSLPTQVPMTRSERSEAATSELAIVGGTNLLSSNMPWYRQWKLDPKSIRALRHKAVLMGVGWWQYQSEPNMYTRYTLKNVLSPDLFHSVRDEYTKEKLRNLGLNVLNTSCPTLWGLDSIVSSEPRPSTCVLTLTDYNKNIREDSWLIALANEHYDQVLIWPQSTRDADYARTLTGRFEVLPPDLESYDQLLNSAVDYVGTRLHGGVRAFQRGQWGVIVAVDNRAVEIGKDTGLPVFQRGAREQIENALAQRTNYRLTLPVDEINVWLGQFSGSD